MPPGGKLLLTREEYITVRTRYNIYEDMHFLYLTYIPDETVDIKIAERKTVTTDKKLVKKMTVKHLSKMIPEEELELYDSLEEIQEAIKMSGIDYELDDLISASKLLYAKLQELRY